MAEAWNHHMKEYASRIKRLQIPSPVSNYAVCRGDRDHQQQNNCSDDHYDDGTDVFI
jgi:hypothetical protein